MDCKKCRKCSIEVSEANAYLNNGRVSTICKKCKIENQQAYYIANREHILQRESNRQKSNREEINARRRVPMRLYMNARLKNDPIFKTQERLKCRMYHILQAKGLKKSKRYHEYIGCSGPELKAYLESQFQPGMTWENHGVNGWHIDHIIPLYTAETIEDVYKLSHYSNLQPLWAVENRKKSNKI